MFAPDGGLNCLCLADYYSAPAFGALLDTERGDAWRFGPQAIRHGQQSYKPETATLVTRWQDDAVFLEFSGLMLWPGNDRGSGPWAIVPFCGSCDAPVRRRSA